MYCNQVIPTSLLVGDSWYEFMKLRYGVDKIKFATDAPTFEKAIGIYESGGVKNFKDNEMSDFSAHIRGSGGNVYDVFVSARRYDEGSCTCYLGQNNTLCKHMVALAIYAVKEGKPLTDEDKRYISHAVCSGIVRELGKGELSLVKKSVTAALKYIKPYNGPSRTWFLYQNSLSEGCNRLAHIVSGLSVSEYTATLLVDMLVRLDDKLARSGVDDSDGTVGGLMEEIVRVLIEYAQLDPLCVRAFNKLKGKETCFGWEEPLLKLINPTGH